MADYRLIIKEKRIWSHAIFKQYHTEKDEIIHEIRYARLCCLKMEY